MSPPDEDDVRLVQAWGERGWDMANARGERIEELEAEVAELRRRLDTLKPGTLCTACQRVIESGDGISICLPWHRACWARRG